MPELSKKGHSMPASPIRKLVPYATTAKSKGIHVYHLNIGQPDIKTPEVVMKGLQSLDMKVIAYSPSDGNSSYKQGLVEYYKDNNIHISTEDILVTTGGSEALFFTMASCFNPGDELIVPEPFYANYNGFAKITGLEIVAVESSIENNYALPPMVDFENKITNKTKGILICNPANPTGYLYSKEEILTLSKIVKKHNLFLIVDEVYREFVYDDEQHFSCMELEGLDDNIIMIDSVSKRYSMCGARIGAIVTRNKELIQTALKFAQARLSPPTFGQIAGELALQTPPSYFDEVISDYIERRNTLVNGLNKIPGVLCPKPKGAFYCMVRLPIDDAEKFCQWILESFSHDNKTVMMAPGQGFYSPGTQIKNEVRIAYVLEKEDLEDAVRILEIALNEYPGKSL